MLRCVAISPDGQVIASAGEKLPLALWHFNSGKRWRNFLNAEGDIRCITFNPDGQLLAGGQNRVMRIWHVYTGDVRHSFEHLGEINCVAFSPNGRILVSADSEGIIKVWQVPLHLYVA